MIITYEYSATDLAKRCHGCKWLRMTDGDYSGVCECKDNKARFRCRSVTDMACAWKNAHKSTDKQEDA